MPRLIADGEVQVHWVPSISTPSAPTVAEITAGTEITPFLSTIDTPLDGDAPDASDLSSAYNKTVAGTFGGNISAELYRDDTTDTAWTTLIRNATGYFVIRRFGGSGVAIAIADEVEVYNSRIITRSPASLDRNTPQMFTVDAAVLDEPELAAVVA
jgi:hypothetical protein